MFLYDMYKYEIDIGINKFDYIIKKLHLAYEIEFSLLLLYFIIYATNILI